jgi:hypothetical protein
LIGLSEIKEIKRGRHDQKASIINAVRFVLGSTARSDRGYSRNCFPETFGGAGGIQKFAAFDHGPAAQAHKSFREIPKTFLSALQSAGSSARVPISGNCREIQGGG